MGIKIKSVLSVHIYSQRKKWELFVHSVHIILNLFLVYLILRHPEFLRTMQRTGPRRKRRAQIGQ